MPSIAHLARLAQALPAGPGRRWLVLLAAFAALVTALPAAAATPATPAEHPATPEAVVEQLDAALIRTMQASRRVDYQTRYQQLAAIMRQAFDFPDMARIATGAGWFGLTPAQKAAITNAFEGYSIATYVSDFNGYSGEHFVMGGRRDMPQGVMVTASLVSPGEQPVTFGYLLHKVGGAWRIIDIYLNGAISQLAVRRSEFSAVLAEAGPNGLIARLEQKTQQLAQGTS